MIVYTLYYHEFHSEETDVEILGVYKNLDTLFKAKERYIMDNEKDIDPLDVMYHESELVED